MLVNSYANFHDNYKMIKDKYKTNSDDYFLNCLLRSVSTAMQI